MANGLYNNTELMDSVIVDLNNTLKELFSGQYIQACCHVTQMSQKLVNLRNTIDNDLKNREATIETLKRQLREMDCEVVDVPVKQLTKKGRC
jgi:hypothetical protein